MNPTRIPARLIPKSQWPRQTREPARIHPRMTPESHGQTVQTIILDAPAILEPTPQAWASTPGRIRRTMTEDQTLYPIRLQGTPEQLKYLANAGATPQEPIIFLMTQEQYQNLPGARDIRYDITFHREFPDGASFKTAWSDCRYFMDDLLEQYGSENPSQPYDEARNPEDLSPQEVHSLIRTIALASNMDSKIDPEANGTTLTEIMEDNGLEPETIFRQSE